MNRSLPFDYLITIISLPLSPTATVSILFLFRFLRDFKFTEIHTQLVE